MTRADIEARISQARASLATVPQEQRAVLEAGITLDTARLAALDAGVPVTLPEVWVPAGAPPVTPG